jgi:hypothetical protein
MNNDPHAPLLRGSLPQEREGTRSLPGPGTDPAWGGPVASRSVRIPLARLAHARSGDKADWVDFGLFAWNAAGYAILEREVTAERVAQHFAPWLPGEVEAWPLPNILALKLVLKGALQGGGARNLRLDNLGKAMAGALLRMEIAVGPHDLAQALEKPREGWWG